MLSRMAQGVGHLGFGVLPPRSYEPFNASATPQPLKIPPTWVSLQVSTVEVLVILPK